jgi:hypothetical protein
MDSSAMNTSSMIRNISTTESTSIVGGNTLATNEGLNVLDDHLAKQGICYKIKILLIYSIFFLFL